MTYWLSSSSLLDRWPAVSNCAPAVSWLRMQENLGLAEGTLIVYARSLDSYLSACTEAGIDPSQANRGDVARWIHQLSGLSNATLQLRLVAVRLFYDYLLEEGFRPRNPVGRGRRRGCDQGPSERGLLPKLHKQPWIPNDEDWLAVLAAARPEPIRNRLMIGLAYDAGLRREELCALRTDDIDPAHRTVRVRAETTKTGYGRVIPYSEITGSLLKNYLGYRSTLSRARGPLFLSESNRNRATPITLWTWSKVVRRIVLRAGVPRFSTHTFRHLCLTDLARAGWELHEIATFAGHRNPATTLLYVHLSGRDLAARLAVGMEQLHRWRLSQVGDAFGTGAWSS
jgi:integrase/recombinase XerD